MFRFISLPFVFLQDTFVNVLAGFRSTHTMLFVKGIEPYRWLIGRWRLWRTYYRALKHVPAYARFIDENGKRARWNGLSTDISRIPSMDKLNYIKKYSIEDRSYGGKLPTRGVIVDESSGSSGTPTSWVRGPYERFMIRMILQVVFLEQTDEKPLFVLNAFALGAWATGMNVSSSLTDVSIIKSTGPDIDKIVNTLLEFGPRYSYIVLGYPPFLKNLVDDPRIDLSKYQIQAGFGGEGMSENMRRYLLKSFTSVTGSYGASDLEINIAVETELSIKLRQSIENNAELAADLIRTDYGVLPMVFQYNPYDYIIETNEAGELLVSITRKENINPRIRYNIHDRGHILRVRELRKILKKHDMEHLLEHTKLDVPLLFHYGRSDLSVDYYGAVVVPDTIREIIYADAQLAPIFETYRLISYEDSHTNKQLLIAVELKAGESLNPAQTKQKTTAILESLRDKNRDFNNACKIAKESTLPRIEIFAFGTGPFAKDKGKLKHEYVWQLNAAEYKALGL
jgi:phenylacetate-CoA ligase